MLRDPRTPAKVRAVIGLAVVYALSPVDLVPDLVPLLGSLDDLVLVPLGLTLSGALAPAAVRAEALQRAAQVKTRALWLGLAAFLALWGLIIWLFARWLIRALG